MQLHRPIIPISTKFSPLKCSAAFQTLTEPQQLYAYYFSRASWFGSKICYFQRSYESPALLYLILKSFSEETPSAFYSRVKNEIGEDILDKSLIYIANFLSNCGNYKSFGDSKFIPDVTSDEFLQVFLKTKYWSEHEKQLKQIYADISEVLYRYESPYGLINFFDQHGTTGYYSKNVTLADAERVKLILSEFDILSENTRLIKTAQNKFVVRIASVITKTQILTSKEGMEITLEYGEFSSFLTSLTQNLTKALEFTANIFQKQMIQKYIEHFSTGDVRRHKQSQIQWIKDKNPSIETNIGFIESYLDPLKIRAEFQGFVAIVNKQESKILNNLVEKAETIIGNLPWGAKFEIQEFKKPDFTSLEVLTFACSSIPIGINIPNYDEIREKYGFKNVNLGNAYGTPKLEDLQYIPDHQKQKQFKYYSPSLFLIVALHELLGHGTGRLFHSLPAFPNPLGYEFSTFYGEGETWHSVFGDIASGYEQCRADGVALYLATYPEILEILLPQYTQGERVEIMEAAWVEIVVSGVEGLEYYDRETDRWTQAHIAAAYALYSVLAEAGGMVEIRQVVGNGGNTLEVHLNRDLILSRGKQAVGEFLKHLQVYKSTADVVRGEAFFKKYLRVDEKLLGYRDIVIKNKKPRKIEVQPDVELVGGKVVYKEFEGDVFSAIESHVFHHRFGFEDVLEEWKKNRPFKY